MLTPEYLWSIADSVVEIWEEINNWAIADIVKRLIAAEQYHYNGIPGAARWRAWLLSQAGMHYDELVNIIAEKTKKSEKEVASLFVQAGLVSMENDVKRLGSNVPDAMVRTIEGLKKSKIMTQILESAYRQTNGELRNFTRTTADASNRLLIKTLDRAYFELTTGMKSREEVIKDAIEKVAAKGVTVSYPSGHIDTIETAVRRAVVTGVNQGAAKITIENCRQSEIEYVMVSAHEGARVSENPIANHTGWQGGIYKIDGETPEYKNLEKATGYPNDPLGLCGYNCRHSFYPYRLGDDNPWENLVDEAKSRKAYELSQKQRKMERAIRADKRELLGLRTAIDNCTDEKVRFELSAEYDRKAAHLQSKNKAYREFCNINELRQEKDRLRIAKWNSQEANRARSGAGRYNKSKNTSRNTEPASIPVTYNKTIFYDETKKWFKEATPDSHKVTDLHEYTVDGNTYKTDGRHVILRYSKNEKRVADVLEKKLGGELFMVPKIDYPTNISTPDYLFRNEKYDLKTLRGTSKNAIYNRLIHMKRQADNFVLDVTDFNFSYEDIEKQIGYVYWSKHTNFVNKIILVKGNDIIKIYSRDK